MPTSTSRPFWCRRLSVATLRTPSGLGAQCGRPRRARDHAVSVPVRHRKPRECPGGARPRRRCSRPRRYPASSAPSWRAPAPRRRLGRGPAGRGHGRYGQKRRIPPAWGSRPPPGRPRAGRPSMAAGFGSAAPRPGLRSSPVALSLPVGPSASAAPFVSAADANPGVGPDIATDAHCSARPALTSSEPPRNMSSLGDSRGFSALTSAGFMQLPPRAPIPVSRGWPLNDSPSS